MNKHEALRLDCTFAALLCDALGVPFEFKAPEGIVDEYIEHPLSIPDTYKSYRTVPVGTISDDGSQILMLYNVIENGLNINEELLSWYQGKYWTNEIVFDCGNQTGYAIRYLQRYGTVQDMPNGSGNGSLMRILPVAFLPYDQIAEQSRKYSYPTHNSEDSLRSCEFYCKLVSRLVNLTDLYGHNFSRKAFNDVWTIVEHEMNWFIKPTSIELIDGSGYVLDSLKLVYRHIMSSGSFKEAVVASIKHGFDTDTNTSILGAVGALVFEFGDYPEEWDTMMRVNETNKYYTDLFGLTHE